MNRVHSLVFFATPYSHLSMFNNDFKGIGNLLHIPPTHAHGARCSCLCHQKRQKSHTSAGLARQVQASLSISRKSTYLRLGDRWFSRTTCPHQHGLASVGKSRLVWASAGNLGTRAEGTGGSREPPVPISGALPV